VLDVLTLPQVLFAVLTKAEWEHSEQAGELQSMALATAAGMGSQAAHDAIKKMAKRKLGQRELTFSEMLDREREKQSAGG